MARPKPWLGKITRIISVLEAWPPQSLTRRDVEQVFGIGRSAARDLMNVVGVRPVKSDDGGDLVTTESLLHYLRNSHDAENAMAEQARRAKLAQRLAVASDEQKLRSIPIPFSSADEWCTLQDMPNVAIEDGVLRVAFSSPTELMGDLMRLAKAAGNNWDEFVRVCRGEERKDEKGAA